MRRAIARGRIVPQSLSTDPRMGRVSLKAALLFPLMWINCDDQGRISGDPDEVKYAVCPNIDHIKKEDVPELLKELETQELIKVYSTSKTKATQMLDWWQEQKLQWAYPSRYPPPEGWADHLRYHPTPKEIITENWPPSEIASEKLPSKPASLPASLPASALPSKSPLTTPSEKERRKGKGKGKGRLPSTLGSPTTTPKETQTTQDQQSPHSRTETGETLCEGDREVISTWRSVKGFKMSPADASELVVRLRTEFTDVDILAVSKKWAVGKISEPLTAKSRPSSQIWSWMCKERQFARERSEREGKGKGQRVAGARPASDFSGDKPW